MSLSVYPSSGTHLWIDAKEAISFRSVQYIITYIPLIQKLNILIQYIVPKNVSLANVHCMVEINNWVQTMRKKIFEISLHFFTKVDHRTK